jgi:hypothetical protein
MKQELRQIIADPKLDLPQDAGFLKKAWHAVKEFFQALLAILKSAEKTTFAALSGGKVERPKAMPERRDAEPSGAAAEDGETLRQ